MDIAQIYSCKDGLTELILQLPDRDTLLRLLMNRANRSIGGCQLCRKKACVKIRYRQIFRRILHRYILVRNGLFKLILQPSGRDTYLHLLMNRANGSIESCQLCQKISMFHNESHRNYANFQANPTSTDRSKV